VTRSLDVDIVALTATGDGLAVVDGRDLAVPFTLPGERVRVAMPPRGTGAAATVIEVLTSSPHRVAPKCVHFGPGAMAATRDGLRRSRPCGGCAWQHIAYTEQLRLKTARVERIVRHAVPGGGAPPVNPMLPGVDPQAPWGYRQKVHFVFANEPEPGRRDGRLVMGHFARGSRRVVAVRECPVHDPRGNAVAFRLFNAFARADVSAAEMAADSRHARALPHSTLRAVVLRVARHTRELLATLVATSDSDRRLRDATRRALAADPPTGLHLTLHASEDPLIFGRQTRTLTGRERMREEVDGISFLLSPTAFFQTNVGAAERLVKLVLAAIPPRSRVLDLYAGVGLFALPLARDGHDVTAIEENPAAVADAEANVRLNRLDAARCRFVAGRAATAIRTLSPADAVVIDPPREGCEQPVLDEIFRRMRPKVVVYVSCNPDALGQDLKWITSHGWSITTVQPVDMFPHTAHIETVVTLRPTSRR
jgi:23S rRNA (uracil1939-C5)-methyltransferase